MNELLILEVQRKLEDSNYPNPLAVSKEIIEFTNADIKKIEEILKRLHKEEPWEYIKGYAHFHNNKIFVNKNTLIPRVETEELVDIIVQDSKKIEDKFQIFDVGTGSGCIAIALNKLLDTKIFAIDISKQALNMAKRNAKLNNCNNIEFVHADLLDFKFDAKLPTIIVANLPYIPSQKIESLDKSVREYEPILALDGGKYGVSYYEKLLEQIKEKDINLIKAYFEIDSSNTQHLEKYNGEFIKDRFNKTRFLVILPPHLK